MDSMDSMPSIGRNSRSRIFKRPCLPQNSPISRHPKMQQSNSQPTSEASQQNGTTEDQQAPPVDPTTLYLPPYPPNKKWTQQQLVNLAHRRNISLVGLDKETQLSILSIDEYTEYNDTKKPDPAKLKKDKLLASFLNLLAKNPDNMSQVLNRELVAQFVACIHPNLKRKDDCWYVFSSGTYWKLMEHHQVQNIFNTCVEHVLRAEIFNMTNVDDDLRKDYNTAVQQILQPAFKYFTTNSANLHEELDRHHHLLGFENGVFDMKAKKFRPGLPTDYISTPLPYKYIEKLDPQQQQRLDKVQKFLNDQLGEEQADCFLDFVADGLGRNEDYDNQKILIIRGRPGCGKSTIIDLVRAAYGGRGKNLNSAQLSKSMDSTKPNPELADMEGALIVTIDENKTSKPWNNATFKTLITGEIAARKLHKNSRTFKRMGPLIGAFNTVPRFEDLDTDGIPRRVWMYVMRNKLFIPDPRLGNDLKRNVDVFMHSLIKRFIARTADYELKPTALITEDSEVFDKVINPMYSIINNLGTFLDPKHKTSGPEVVYAIQQFQQSKKSVRWDSKRIYHNILKYCNGQNGRPLVTKTRARPADGSGKASRSLLVGWRMTPLCKKLASGYVPSTGKRKSTNENDDGSRKKFKSEEFVRDGDEEEGVEGEAVEDDSEFSLDDLSDPELW